MDLVDSMSEVRIPAPVKARWVETEQEFFDDEMMAREPGLLMFEDNVAATLGNSRRVLYSCPCGCGAAGAVRVGENEKPAEAPSWAWTGGKEATTFHPSVHHVGHWHGWLKNGYWEQA